MTKNQQRLTWVLILTATGVVLLGVFWLAIGSKTPRPGESIEILGRQHIQVGASHERYNSNPPTSGSHYARPTDWGVYRSELADENVIHSMEHGGIWISYRPDVLNETIESRLEAIGERYPERTVVSPRAANDAPIALASWGRLETMETFDEARIIEFIRRNTNKSPEPIAR